MLVWYKFLDVMSSLPVMLLIKSQFKAQVSVPLFGSETDNNLTPLQFASVGFAAPDLVIPVRNVFSAW